MSHVPCEPVLHLQAIGTLGILSSKQVVLPVSAEALHRCAALFSVHRCDPETRVVPVPNSLVSFPDSRILLVEFFSCLSHRKVYER